MEDASHPVAMCSGMLIGMMMGATLFAGTFAWRNAATTLCKVIAVEAGRSEIADCPRLAPEQRASLYGADRSF